MIDGINNRLPWRLLMRTATRLHSRNAITYSYTDEQVMFSVKFALFTGAVVGGVIVGFLMSALTL